MKKSSFKWMCCLLCLVAKHCLFATQVYGDLIVLENKETLSGSFSRIKNNTLVFRTSLAGQMMTPLENVKQISSTVPLYVEMENGQVYFGRLAVRQDRQVIEPLDGGSAHNIQITDIKETLPIPTVPEGIKEEDKEAWLTDALPDIQKSDGYPSLSDKNLQFDASGKSAPWDAEEPYPDKGEGGHRLVSPTNLGEPIDKSETHPGLSLNFEAGRDTTSPATKKIEAPLIEGAEQQRLKTAHREEVTTGAQEQREDSTAALTSPFGYQLRVRAFPQPKSSDKKSGESDKPKAYRMPPAPPLRLRYRM